MTSLTAHRITELDAVSSVEFARHIVTSAHLAQEHDDMGNNGSMDSVRRDAYEARRLTRAEEATILVDRFPQIRYDRRWFGYTPTVHAARIPREDPTR